MLRIESSGTHHFGRWLFLLVASAILLVPAIAMQFTSEVNWGPEDFGAMGLMLVLVGLALEVSPRLSKTALQAGLAVGFIIFVFSDFGGTIALGLFTAITLFVALLSNLLLLPALLLSFDSEKDV